MILEMGTVTIGFFACSSFFFLTQKACRSRGSEMFNFLCVFSFMIPTSSTESTSAQIFMKIYFRPQTLCPCGCQ